MLWPRATVVSVLKPVALPAEVWAFHDGPRTSMETRGLVGSPSPPVSFSSFLSVTLTHSPALARNTNGRGRKRRLPAGSAAGLSLSGRCQFFTAALSPCSTKSCPFWLTSPQRLKGIVTLI